VQKKSCGNKTHKQIGVKKGTFAPLKNEGDKITADREEPAKRFNPKTAAFKQQRKRARRRRKEKE